MNKKIFKIFLFSSVFATLSEEMSAAYKQHVSPEEQEQIDLAIALSLSETDADLMARAIERSLQLQREVPMRPAAAVANSADAVATDLAALRREQHERFKREREASGMPQPGPSTKPVAKPQGKSSRPQPKPKAKSTPPAPRPKQGAATAPLSALSSAPQIICVGAHRKQSGSQCGFETTLITCAALAIAQRGNTHAITPQAIEKEIQQNGWQRGPFSVSRENMRNTDMARVAMELGFAPKDLLLVAGIAELEGRGSVFTISPASTGEVYDARRSEDEVHRKFRELKEGERRLLPIWLNTGGHWIAALCYYNALGQLCILIVDPIGRAPNRNNQAIIMCIEQIQNHLSDTYINRIG